MGKTVRFDNQADLTVTGLIKNLPSNTKLRYDAFISYATIPTLLGTDGKQAMQDWANVFTVCFVTLREGTPVERLLEAFPLIRKKYLTTPEAKRLDFHSTPGVRPSTPIRWPVAEANSVRPPYRRPVFSTGVLH